METLLPIAGVTILSISMAILLAMRLGDQLAERRRHEK